jgi:hypothetical protein
MSEVVKFPKHPYPEDSNPKGRWRRVLVEPEQGGWGLTYLDDDGCSDGGVHSKREALHLALAFVDRFNAELELVNRPHWDRSTP